MAETNLRKPIIKQLRENNALVFCVIGNMRQEPGWPDVYISHSYWTGWIEFKGYETPVSEKQKHIIQQLNKRNPNSAFVVRFYNGSTMEVQESDGKPIFTDLHTGKELLSALYKLSQNAL